MTPTFWLPPKFRREDIIYFPAEEEHHILHVLRMKEGDLVEVLCENRTIQAKLIKGPKGLKGKIISSCSLPTPRFSVDLAQSLPKGRKIEQLISLASQIGVRRLFPFLSSRSIPKLNPSEEGAKKHERWQKIAEEEAKVTGELPVTVESLKSFSQVLALSPQYPLSFFFWENAERPLKEVLASQEKPASVLIIIGPEGGFSPQEAKEAENKGFFLVHLGSRILRSEIAGFVAATILLERWGDLAS